MSYSDIAFLQDSIKWYSASNSSTGGVKACCRLWPVPFVAENNDIDVPLGQFSEGGKIRIGMQLSPIVSSPENPGMNQLAMQNFTLRYFLQTITETTVEGTNEDGGDATDGSIATSMSGINVIPVSPSTYTRTTDGTNWSIWAEFDDPAAGSSTTFVDNDFGGVTTSVSIVGTVYMAEDSYGLVSYLYYECVERIISSYNAARAMIIAGYSGPLATGGKSLGIYYRGTMPVPIGTEAAQGDNCQLYPSFQGTEEWYETMTITPGGPGAGLATTYNYNDVTGGFFGQLSGQTAMKVYIYNNAIEYVYLGNFIGGGTSTSLVSPQDQGYILTDQTATKRVWSKGSGLSIQTIIIELSNALNWDTNLVAVNTWGGQIISLSLVSLVGGYKSDESTLVGIKQPALTSGNYTTGPNKWDYPGAVGNMLVVNSDGTWSIETLTIPSGTDVSSDDYFTFIGEAPPYILGGVVIPSSRGSIILAIGNFTTPTLLSTLASGLSISD